MEYKIRARIYKRSSNIHICAVYFKNDIRSTYGEEHCNNTRLLLKVYIAKDALQLDYNDTKRRINNHLKIAKHLHLCQVISCFFFFHLFQIEFRYEVMDNYRLPVAMVAQTFDGAPCTTP